MTEKDTYSQESEFMDEEGDGMAFGVGIGHGFKQVDPRPKAKEYTQNNPYYYYPGFALGYLGKSIALFLLGRGLLG